MNKYLKTSAMAIAAILALTTASAQKEKEKKEKSDKKSQTITIVRNHNSDSSEKFTVVVDGEKITINGKPIEEYKGSDIKVITGDNNFRMISPSRAYAPVAGRVPMHVSGVKGADVFSSWNSNAAMLGVSSDDGDGGAKITEVTKDGAADKAGLKEGDIITKVNEFNVSDADDLPMAIKKFKPEEKVTITYKRNGATQTTTAELQKSTNNFGQNFKLADTDFAYNFDMNNKVFSTFGRPRLGLQVEDLQDGNGVKVLDVNDDTPAGKAGIKKDDVITSFNGKEIKGVDDIREAMQDIKQGDTIKVSYKRAGSPATAEIKFPKPVKKANI